jgi:hypothetical protein
MFKSIFFLFIVSSHVFPSIQFKDETYELRLDISGANNLHMVTSPGQSHVAGRIKEILVRRLNHRHAVNFNNNVVQRKEIFKGNVLEVVYRITTASDSSTLATIVEDSVSIIEKKLNLDIRYNLWAIAPRTVQLEQCLALLEEDCSVEGSGCKQLHKSSGPKYTDVVDTNKMINDEEPQHEFSNMVNLPIPIESRSIEIVKCAVTTPAPVAHTTKQRLPTPTIRHVLELNTSIATDCLNGQWFRQLGRLPGTHTVHQNGTLVLKNLVGKDGGAYYCKVDGNKVLNLVIAVLEKPVTMEVTSSSFYPATSSFSQKVGLPLTLYCNVDPIEAGDVKWSRVDNRPLRKGVEQLDNSLRFKNISCDDVGKYTCSLIPVSSHLQGLSKTVNVKPFQGKAFCPTK